MLSLLFLFVFGEGSYPCLGSKVSITAQKFSLFFCRGIHLVKLAPAIRQVNPEQVRFNVGRLCFSHQTILAGRVDSIDTRSRQPD